MLMYVRDTQQGSSRIHHSKMNVKFDWITELTMAKK